MKSSSNKSKNALQKMKVPTALEVTVKFVDGDSKLINDYSSSMWFKVYLKSQLVNKLLTKEFVSEVTFLNSKISYQVVSALFKEDEAQEDCASFTCGSDTEIVIDISSFQVDILRKEMEDKWEINDDDQQCDSAEWSVENKEILKEMIERKKWMSERKVVKDIAPINYEEQYERIINIMNVTLGITGTEGILLNQTKIGNYMYKGVTVTGPSGIGKTHLLNCVINNILGNKITLFEINCFKNLQEKDKAVTYLKTIFKFAKLLPPSVIVFEDIDTVFPNWKENPESSGSQETEFNPLLASFIREVDGLVNNKVFLLTTCTMISKVNQEIIKNNRIDYTWNLSLPSFQERKNIIVSYLKDFNSSLTDTDIDVISDKTHGFVPGDIAKLFKESYMKSLWLHQETLSFNVLESTWNDIKPINLKDIIIDVPKVKWDEIGGNKDIINQIRQSVEWPLKNPGAFTRLGITPPNGTLLYGPPGCSKTLIAKAWATESGLNFFAVKGPELFSKYVGDTEKAIRDVFKKAKISSPSIIFFDEIDSMAAQRSNDSHGVEDKVLCQWLNEMDGIEGREKVVIFGATNRPDIWDKAWIRPGRFDRLIYIPPPDEISREDIFKITFNKMKIEETVDFKELSQITSWFSGADIAKVAREAGMLALSQDINSERIPKQCIIDSIRLTKPIITKEMITYFEEFSKKALE